MIGWRERSSTPTNLPATSSTLPYMVGEIAERDGTVCVLLVANKGYPESDARTIVNQYISEYRGASALIVDFLCSSQYASIAYYWDTPADYHEYDKYVMYEYIMPRMRENTEFFSYRANPFDDTQGIYCKS